MKYRKLGKTGEEVSILGFGCMRFPQKDEKIDEEKSLKMIRYAIDNGVNYIDTAYPYHNGESEIFLGKALKDGYREKIKLATKLPSWAVNKREDMDKFINEQLKKLQTNQIDFYLIHSLNKEDYGRLKENGLFDFIRSIKEEKLVKYVGFSFHDTLDVFKYIIDDYEWDFVQIQYNYIDEKYQAGTEGLLYAHNKGLGVIIMEPLRGGALVNNLSGEIKSIIKNAPIKKNAVEWAFKFLYDKEEISVVLSGMSSLEQVIDNIKAANSQGDANLMTKFEKQIIEELSKEFKSKIKVNCTGCKYCLPCPKGVQIPLCFELLNSSSMFNDIKKAKDMYHGFLVSEGSDASNCGECGACEQKCPQHINIVEKLKEVRELFE
ncbi:aldo/keto reductase [Romboutsia lituseburensis]|uniref:aldo/keto reductase n=1 Tax=Romboutsia lituseburensis TaxID=1537 RepID=UPI00215B47FD|nr:aldo/keto reductase [Romboutsia lituseburensis]MCR8744846.1 aldo/keto reductase [Romboutsia lituseburensis]